MTIICYDGKSVAADRQHTSGSTVVGYRKKIHTHPKGWFVCCGTSCDLPLFRRWFESGESDGMLSENFAAMYSVNGEVFITQKDLKPWLSFVPCAIGSTYEAAEALMRAGFTAEEAAAEHIKYDVNCGGKIDVLDVLS